MYGPGAQLANRYRLDERVGGGGMGEVWRATDEVLGRTVAVKVMRPELLEEPGFAERFLAEARTMATIKHRGVVAVHDYQGNTSGAFLVMEYVDGEALSRRLHRFGRLDPVRTMNLVAQAADALQAAHDRGVVHRDIKPGNLLVTADDTLVLTDFGIARSAASTPLTATGAVIGTPSYLAPEQVLGKPATPLSDVYALGVVAYECVTGRRPFDGENPFDVAMKRLREPPPTMTGDVPMAVLAVVERTLAADPADRWPSAAALAAAARQAVAPDQTPPVGPATPTTPAPTSPVPTSPVPTSPAPATPRPADRPASPAAPAFSPARVPVPGPVQPVAPTMLDQRSPVPPTTPPPSSPYPATRPPIAPQPPRLPGPPVTLVLASLALVVSALGLFVYCAATAAIIDDVDRIAELQYGWEYERDWRAVTVGSSWLTVGSLGLLALLFLLFALLNARGSRGSRAWTFVLGCLVLFCCGPCWWFASLDSLAADPTTREYEFRQQLSAELDWYGPLAGRSVVIAVGALLIALLLLMVPPTNRYFRFFRPMPRPAYYYPYYPYYPHPPRR
jgi:serine/threonine-protein kinase